MQAVLKGVDHNGVQKPGEMAAESFLGFSSIFSVGCSWPLDFVGAQQRLHGSHD